MGSILGGIHSVHSDPDRDACDNLAASYDRLVAANPLPARVKSAILATAFGSPQRYENVLRAAGRHSEAGGNDAASTEEEVLLQLTRMAMATVPSWPADKLSPWRAVSGGHFAAWANLVAFAAQASIVEQCHLTE